MGDPGQIEAVQRLFLKHSGVLKGFILGLLPDFNRSEDVFQELFLTITSKAAEFTPGTDFLAWSRTIARFKVLEHCRKSRPAAAPLSPHVMEMLAADAPGSEESWSRHRAVLSECLKDVAPKSREILDLRYSQGLLPPEIARRLAWTVDSLHVALARARRFLRECTQRKLAVRES